MGFMRTTGRIAVATLGAAAMMCAPGASSDHETIQNLYERVFGDAAKLNGVMCAMVAEDESGKRHYVDNDGDGKPEEVWFIDLALRHRAGWRPVLVRVIDEDGDLEVGGEPDLDSDLYLADWKADGTVNVVTDYTDRDGDNDVDEMAFYFPRGDELMVWWGDDIGDDNLLWYDVGYTYNQSACQYRSHFGGDELFSAFHLGLDDAEWTPAWEDPFVFYDHDRDGVTEEVIRIEGRREVVHNLRYSFDADDDATPDSPRDFDVSISAHAPKAATFEARLADLRTLRGIPTGPFLEYHAVPGYAHGQEWTSMMLTWDENDLNMDGDSLSNGRFRDTQERWEGVIGKGNEHFRQIGGPSVGALNKRFEVAATARVGLRLYYSPTDQRLHLPAADHAWMAVDVNYDQKADMRYDYADANGDGYIDTWKLDVDGDGEVDDTWTAGDAAVTVINYTWPEVRSIMAPLLSALPERLHRLDARLEQALATVQAPLDEVRVLMDSAFDVPTLNEDLRARLLSSNESCRYYLDLLKDRLLLALKRHYDNAEFWGALNPLRSQGDLEGMRTLVEKTFDLSDDLPALAGVRARLLAKLAQPRVAWGQDWVPPNIGWESDVCAYRAYWGQFDFFGKKQPALVVASFGDQVNYHAEQDWGMDALHVGKTCGLGGVSLYVNGEAYPVWSPEGDGAIVWSKRLLSQTDAAVTVELLAEKVGPSAHPYTVRYRCSAHAGRKDSPIEVTVEGGGDGATLELGIGLTTLPQEAFAIDTEAGVMASWGFQDAAIGTIGMGVLFPPDAFVRCADQPGYHEVVVRIDKGAPLTYGIQGDWLRGRRFPRCPTMTNWLDELRETARRAALDHKETQG